MSEGNEEYDYCPYCGVHHLQQEDDGEGEPIKFPSIVGFTVVGGTVQVTMLIGEITIAGTKHMVSGGASYAYDEFSKEDGEHILALLATIENLVERDTPQLIAEFDQRAAELRDSFSPVDPRDTL